MLHYCNQHGTIDVIQKFKQIMNQLSQKDEPINSAITAATNSFGGNDSKRFKQCAKFKNDSLHLYIELQKLITKFIGWCLR